MYVKMIQIELFRVCFTLIMMAGFFWQVYNINQLYMEYPTVVNTIVSKSDYLYMPGFTICIDYDMSDKETLIKLYPDEDFSASSSEDLRRLFLQTPIDSIYRIANIEGRVNLTCTVHCTADARFLKSHEGSLCVDVPCELYSKPIQTLSWARNNVIRLCTTYFIWNSTDSPLVEYRYDGRDLIEITGTASSPVTLIFSMHSGCNLPWTELEDFSSLSLHRYRRFLIDYMITTFRLVKPPYKTNCSDYPEYGVFGRTGCLHSCQANVTQSLRSTWPLNVPARPETQLAFFPSNGQLNRDRSSYLKLLAQCLKLCSQPECSSYSVTYSVKNEHLITNQTEGPFTSKIHIFRPRSYDVKYIHRPAIAFIEYFTYIGGSFGLWFGFSILTFLDKILEAFTDKTNSDNSSCEKVFSKRFLVANKSNQRVSYAAPTSRSFQY